MGNMRLAGQQKQLQQNARCAHLGNGAVITAHPINIRPASYAKQGDISYKVVE
jgi:hypothetical protein